MDVLTIVAVVVVAGVTFGIARTIKVREKRRREPKPVIAWQPAPEPDESETYAAQQLRELGLDHLIERPYRGRRLW